MHVFNCKYMTNLFDSRGSVAYILCRYLRILLNRDHRTLFSFTVVLDGVIACGLSLVESRRLGCGHTALLVHCCCICRMVICHLWSVCLGHV